MLCKNWLQRCSFLVSLFHCIAYMLINKEWTHELRSQEVRLVLFGYSQNAVDKVLGLTKVTISHILRKDNAHLSRG
jgi:hypothetical protein